MFRSRLALVALVFAVLAPSARALTDQDFQQWYREALPKVANGEFPALRGMDNLRILLVGGFLGEALKDKFLDTRRDLIRMGAAPHKVTILTPVSTLPIEENGEKLRQTFESLTTAGEGERIVVVGHSKGAAESLLGLLTADTSLRKRIAGAYFVQGAFGGSPLADLFLGDGHEVDDSMAAPYRYLLQAVLKLDPASKLEALEGYLGMKLGRGLESLKQEEASKLWEDALQNNPDGIRDLDGKVFYVRSYLPPQEVRTTFRIPAEYLSAYYGPNDGVVPLRSQTLGGFGRLLGTLRSDHIALTRGNLPPGVERNRQAAFTVALGRSILKLAGELP